MFSSLCTDVTLDEDARENVCESDENSLFRSRGFSTDLWKGI